ncbi:MAG: dockerin type I repeat-containing protein [Ruminococcus flavefaciens]|nr:dockerin type I repeat-containing protein [Ruminococcus flavefaciens]
MKKLLSTLLCLSVMTGIVPTVASAKSEPIFIEKGAENWSKTVISGDINDDGKLNVADAVILQKCLMDNYSYDEYKEIESSRLDINFDGVFDVFDLVQMRQTVLHPENAPVQTWAIDSFESDSVFESHNLIEDGNQVFTTYGDMSGYLSTIMSDGDMQKFTDRYDETFFEENNLILQPFTQSFGEGGFYEIAGVERFNSTQILNKNVNGIAFVLNSDYEYNEGLYPAVNTNLLAQITVPKCQSSADDMTVYADSSHFFRDLPDRYSYTDGNHELVFIHDSRGLHHHATDVYIKNDDGSFTYVADMFDFDFPEDHEGLSGENYNIYFRADCFVIDYYSHKIQSSYDGEDVIEIDGSETSYLSPDGTSKLHFIPHHYSGNFNSGDIGRETSIDIYLEESDGHLKHLGDLQTEYRNMPFTEDGEWSVDTNGNSVFGNGETYSVTWLDDAVTLSWKDGSWTAVTTVPFENSGYEIAYTPH